MVDKIIYMMVTRPEISFVCWITKSINVQNMDIHQKAALRVLAYIKNSPGNWLFLKKYGYVYIFAFSYVEYVGDKDYIKFITGYLTFVEGNQVFKSRGGVWKKIQCFDLLRD